MCGSSGLLMCSDVGQAAMMCSAMCTNNTSQAMEQAQCGGRGATCLTIGDTMPQSICTHACRGTQANPGCLGADQVCTGWWFTHMAGADAAGCWPFCHSDAECPSGQHCDRLGSCRMEPVSTTLRHDGEPCNPMTEPMMGPSTQCNGACFNYSGGTNGICGSLVDVAMTTDCPDMQPNVQVRAPAGDKLGICIFKDCNCDADCTAPLLCVVAQAGMPGACVYPDLTAMPPEHGTPTCPAGDGGVGDGG
jgi:hypothetical protein